MVRIRTVKPEVYRHEKLYDLEKKTGLPVRLFWIGLFAVCDREGRFKWRPGSIKLDILPFDIVDVSLILDELWGAGFITRYRSKTDEFGCIPTFRDHQVINGREAQSKLPAWSDQNCEVLTCGPRVTETHVHARGEQKGREGKGTEGKGREARVVTLAPVPDKSGSVPTAGRPLNLSEPVNPQNEIELLNLLPRHVLEKWSRLHPDAEFLNRELIKAFGYYRLNPRKCPQNRRGWAQALSSWFERDWPKHAARVPGQRPDEAKLNDWIKAGQSPSTSGQGFLEIGAGT